MQFLATFVRLSFLLRLTWHPPIIGIVHHMRNLFLIISILHGSSSLLSPLPHKLFTPSFVDVLGEYLSPDCIVAILIFWPCVFLFYLVFLVLRGGGTTPFCNNCPCLHPAFSLLSSPTCIGLLNLSTRLFCILFLHLVSVCALIAICHHTFHFMAISIWSKTVSPILSTILLKPHHND